MEFHLYWLWTSIALQSLPITLVVWVGYQSEKTVNSFYVCEYRSHDILIVGRTNPQRLLNTLQETMTSKYIMAFVIETHTDIQKRCANFLMLVQLIQLWVYMKSNDLCLLLATVPIVSCMVTYENQSALVTRYNQDKECVFMGNHTAYYYSD